MEKNKIRSVALSQDFDKMVEDTRKRLGMNRSAFFKYAMTKLLQELSVLSTTVHCEEKNQKPKTKEAIPNDNHIQRSEDNS